MDLARFGLSQVQESTTAGGLRLISGTVGNGLHDQAWRALRQAHARTGWWPVLGWSAVEAAKRTFNYEPETHEPGRLTEALAIDASRHMALLSRSSYEEHIEEDDPNDPEGADSIAYWRDYFDPDVLARLLDPVPTPPAGIRRYTRDVGRYDLLLVPAGNGYELPVLVPGLLHPPNWFGAAWHRSLTLADHLAVLRHWQQRYGAEVYYIRRGLELTVQRPPRGPRAVARCAIEQMTYCNDLHQILGEVDDVARRQAPADHWSFWWD